MRRLLWNEWRIVRRQGGLRILFLVYLAMLGYGALQSVDRVRDHGAQVVAATDDYERRWSSLRAAADAPVTAWADWKSPSLVGGPTGFAVTWIPVDGLAALSPGESTRVSVVRRISIYAGGEDPPLQNPLTPAGGLFDLSFVVVWLLPVLLLAATHGVVSADRQHGTWSLVAATTPRPGRVLAARLLWPAAAFAATTVAAGVITTLAAAPLPAEGGWARLAAWTALVLVYVGFWTMAAGVATTRCTTASQTLGGLGLFWMALVWVGPGLIDAGVAGMVPATNKVAPQIAARELARDLDAKLPLMLEDIYHRYPQWRPSPEVVAAARRPVPGGPASRDARRVYVPALLASEIAAPFHAEAARRRDRTERLVRYASVLSPALALQLIADHLAGTSAERFVAFERHAAAAERTWHDFFAPRILQLRDLTRSDMAATPTPPPFSDVPAASAVVWPVAGLCIWTLAAGALLVASVRYLRT